MNQSEKTAKHYDRQAQAFELYCPRHYSCLHGTVEETHELLEKYLKLGKDDNILEIGYGRGHFGKYLIDKGHKYTGIDASKKSRMIANRREFKCGDFYDAQGHYSRIFSNEVMVHIDSHQDFFNKCASLQESGDIMVHKEMHIEKYGAIDPLTCMLGLNPIFDWTGRYHTLKADKKWLDEAGYNVEIVNWDIKYYIKTLEDWIELMKDNRSRLVNLLGVAQYLNTMKTWKVFIHVWKQNKMKVNIMICQKR